MDELRLLFQSWNNHNEVIQSYQTYTFEITGVMSSLAFPDVLEIQSPPSRKRWHTTFLQPEEEKMEILEQECKTY